MSHRSSVFKRYPRLMTLAVAGVLILLCDFVLGRIYAKMEYSHIRHRMRSPIYHHDLRPLTSVQAEPWGQRRTDEYVNSLGFRDRSSREIALKSNRPRIIFIGDSFTEGLGVNYEQTFVGRIEEHLGPRGVDVLNAAVASYSPIIYLRKTRYLIEQVGLQFDELVVFLDLSDIVDELEYEFDAQGNVVNSPAPPLEPKPAPKNIWERNSLVAQFYDRYQQARTMALASPLGLNRPRALWTVDEALYQRYGAKGLETAARHMDELQALLKAHHIRLTLAVYPWPDQIHQRDRDSRHTRFWRDWANRQAVPFLDYFPSFIDAKNDPDTIIRRYYLPGDVHWNEAGHSLVAQIFLDFYRSNRTDKAMSAK